jgi:His/Glu/Gln/Arg/opine family amino acid ABC transporter permease subunit
VQPTGGRASPIAPRWRLSNRAQSLLGVLFVLIALPVAFRMEPRNFSPFADLAIWRFIGEGVLTVIVVSIVAIVVSLPAAVALAIGRLSTKHAIRFPSIGAIEIIRALPLLLVIFYTFLSLPRDVPLFFTRETVALTLALMIYTAVIAPVSWRWIAARWRRLAPWASAIGRRCGSWCSRRCFGTRFPR